jgi:hypothetical protein
MKRRIRKTLKSFLLEIVLYSALVALYYAFVLHYLGDDLNHIFLHNRKLYAGLALGLIVGQGFLLEALTRLLLAWIQPRSED